MYIVFERDQCYPKYLIKYKLTKSLSHLSDWNANPSVSIPISVGSSSTASSVSGLGRVQTSNAGTSYSSSLSWGAQATQFSTSQSASLPYTTPYHGSSATGNQSTSRSSQANDKNTCIIQ